MPEEIKKENYQNLGGINRKVSQYQTGSQFALDISNMDFYSPGAWTKRWGSTFYAGVGGNPINGLFEFTNLTGASRQMFGSSTNMYGYNGTSFIIQPGLQSSNFYNFSNFVDRVFYCNGSNFMKFSGTTSFITDSNFSSLLLYSNFLYSLPKPQSSLTIQNSGTVGNQTLIVTYSYGYVNDRGFHGPVSNGYTGILTGQSMFLQMYADIVASGGSTFTGFSIPASYGIGFSTIISYAGTTQTAGLGWAILAFYRDNGPGTGRYRIGYDFNPWFSSAPILTPFVDKSSGSPSYIILSNGATYNVLAQSNFPEPTCISPTLVPTLLEIYNNQLFMAGFTQAPSTVQFSDIGEPESVQPGFNFEVRTNDGDVLTAFKPYQSQLFMFKQRSFHALGGDNPNNFSIREISDQYGTLNPRTVATFEDKMIFLDRKGLALYNGAAQSIISNQVEDIFLSMNLPAAVTHSIVMHNRPQNQIWCSIPVNGATLNNVTVVYDYLLQGWTTYKGFVPNIMAMMRAGFNKETPFYGDNTGNIYNFGQSLYGDCSATLVVGISCQVLTRFQSDEGESTQKLFRRLWTNINPVTASTTPITGKFYSDYDQSTIQGTFAIGATIFQSRVDFGISAKSIAIEYNHFSSTEPFVLQGFALGQRFLRNV